MATFNISANDTNFGEYAGATAAEALDAYARDAGYSDYSEVAEEFGDDAVATEIDTDALCSAAGTFFGSSVFQDAYGSGVALINGVSYGTYSELAEAIGKSAWDFKAA